MTELGRSYIENTINNTENEVSIYFTDRLPENTGWTRAKLAETTAQQGDRPTTASHLKRDDISPIHEKGNTLATAFEAYAKKSTLLADFNMVSELKKQYQAEAQQSQKIAQDLRQAAQNASKE